MVELLNNILNLFMIPLINTGNALVYLPLALLACFMILSTTFRIICGK